MPTEILTVPDERLSQPCLPPSDAEVAAVVPMLIEAAEASQIPAAGLAAPQIGHLVRTFIIRRRDEWIAVTNPRLLSRSPREMAEVEACLSTPGFQVPVSRPVSVLVAFEQGIEREWINALSFAGPAARVFQHELDHLDGLLITRFAR